MKQGQGCTILSAHPCPCLFILFILSIYAYVCTIIYTPILILHTIIYTYIYATFNAYTAFMPCLLYDSILYFTMLTIIYFICNAMSARHVRLWAPGCVIGPAWTGCGRIRLASRRCGRNGQGPIWQYGCPADKCPARWGHKKRSPPGLVCPGDSCGRGGYLLSHFRSIIGVVRFNFSVRDG